VFQILFVGHKKASVGRFFTTTKIGFQPQKAFHYYLGYNEHRSIAIGLIKS
jgi:hypothetical protein